MKKQKKWLYEKWLEDHKKEEEQENISRKIGVEKDKVVVKKVSFLGKLLEIATDLLFKVVFGLITITAVALMSLGATVLLNPELRTIVFETLELPFF